MSRYLLLAKESCYVRAFLSSLPVGVDVCHVGSLAGGLDSLKDGDFRGVILGPGDDESSVFDSLDRIWQIFRHLPVMLYFPDGDPHQIRRGFLSGALDCVSDDILKRTTAEKFFQDVHCRFHKLDSFEPVSGCISCHQFIKAFESSLDGMAILDDEEKYILLNLAHARIYGYEDPSELVGRSWRSLYDAGELARFDREIFPILLSRGWWIGEAVGKRKDGSRFPQELSLMVFHNGGLSCVVRDISSQREVLDELRRQRDNAEMYFQAVGIMMMAVSPAGRIIRVNNKGADLLGYDSPLELEGVDWFLEFVPESSRNQERESFLDMVSEKKEISPLQESWIVTCQGRHRLIQWSNSLLRDEEGIVTSVIRSGHDVTYRRQVEGELLEKNREMNDFVYIVSHDLKNPLNILKGFITAIRDDPALFDKYFDRVICQADILSEFINSLLKLSRAGKVIGQKAEISPEFLIRRAFGVTRPPGDDSRLIMETPLPVIKGDPERMTQIFVNIISNCIQYRDPARPLEINVSHRDNGGQVTLVISDNGIGIERENLSKVFEAGHTLRKSRGTGFGLPISRKIVEAHGGCIWADSPGPGKGTSFFIKLPLT